MDGWMNGLLHGRVCFSHFKSSMYRIIFVFLFIACDWAEGKERIVDEEKMARFPSIVLNLVCVCTCGWVRWGVG